MLILFTGDLLCRQPLLNLRSVNFKEYESTRAKILRHVFRFIDDLIALNYHDEFMRFHKDIYPPEME